jgi:hypothetical protein
MINSLYLNILKYVGFALAGILIFFKIRNDGKDSVRSEQVAQVIEGVKIRDKIEKKNSTLSGDDHRQWLYDNSTDNK